MAAPGVAALLGLGVGDAGERHRLLVVSTPCRKDIPYWVQRLGQRDQNQVENAPPGSSYSSVQEAAERGPKRTKAGIALLSVGGAAVVGGIIWQLTGGHEEAMPEVSIGPTGISVKGRF